MPLFSKTKYLAKIDNYIFLPYFRPKVQESLGIELDDSDWQLICEGFKQYVKAWVMSGYKGLAMPSQSVDALWHEMILNTLEYQKFCENCLGKFLHHTSRAALDRGELKNAMELWQTWEMCAKEAGHESLDFYTLKDMGALFDSDRKIYSKHIEKMKLAIKEKIKKEGNTALQEERGHRVKHKGFFWFSNYEELAKFENQRMPNNLSDVINEAEGVNGGLNSADRYETGNMETIFNYLQVHNYFVKTKPKKGWRA